ncbi:MAG TPA: response regulator transcription factor [Bdellovibrionales bacterium]|nr:response regulator transcription factor [Bdellovibrionales bacterium]
MRKILLVQQDPQLRQTLFHYLQDYFSVQVTENTRAALRAAAEWLPEVVILDEAASALEPRDLLHDLRNSDQLRHVGIVVLVEDENAVNEESLYLRGADIVLKRETKLNSLVLRLSALLQRIDGFQQLQDSKLTIGDVVIDPRSKSVEWKSQRVPVTPTQYALLFAFACHPNQVLTRKWMQQNVWKGGKVSPRSIDAQVSKLKRILPSLHDLIVNVYGEGYLLMPPKKAA